MAVRATRTQKAKVCELTIDRFADQREEVFLPGERQPLESEPDQLGVALLRRLRDEAHRFAVTFHRQQRGERMKRSRLSDIPGVGPKRVKDLLAHFHSIDAIQLASIEVLSQAPGVGPSMARQIHAFFHPSEEDLDSPQPTPTAAGGQSGEPSSGL